MSLQCEQLLKSQAICQWQRQQSKVNRLKPFRVNLLLIKGARLSVMGIKLTYLWFHSSHAWLVMVLPLLVMFLTFSSLFWGTKVIFYQYFVWFFCLVLIFGPSSMKLFKIVLFKRMLFGVGGEGFLVLVWVFFLLFFLLLVCCWGFSVFFWFLKMDTLVLDCHN